MVQLIVTDAPADIVRLGELHRARVSSARLASVALLAALYAFFQDRRRCGELDGDVEGDRVWMTCSCGAVLVRVVAFG